MKTLWLLTAREQHARAREILQAADLVRAAKWPETALRLSLLSGLPEQAAESPADLVIQCWSEESVALPPALGQALAGRFDVTGLEVDERVRKDISGWSEAGEQPGVSLLAFCASPIGQTRCETLRHWTEHVRLAVTIHHGTERYIQNVICGESPNSPWFGIAELHFPDAEGIATYLFRSEADVAIIQADVADFVVESPTMHVTEFVVRA